MEKENATVDFRLTKSEETRNYFLEKIKQWINR